MSPIERCNGEKIMALLVARENEKPIEKQRSNCTYV